MKNSLRGTRRVMLRARKAEAAGRFSLTQDVQADEFLEFWRLLTGESLRPEQVDELHRILIEAEDEEKRTPRTAS